MSATLGKVANWSGSAGGKNCPSSCFRGMGAARNWSQVILLSERSLDEKSATDLAIDMIKETSRSLVLVPNDKLATFKNINFKILDIRF